MQTFENSPEFATQLDQSDSLNKFRNEFVFPQHEGGNCIYFTGNSLGLMPKSAKDAVLLELEDWGKYGVEGHFNSTHPWFSYHEMFKQPLANLVGAKPVEVNAMNGLSANLHFLLISMYQPTKERYKIICEAKAFPSDHYILQSQAKLHGFSPTETIIEIAPREGEHTLRHEDIIQTIEKHAASIAVIMIGGVNYYTGQVFDMKSITEEGHKAGAIVGFDLAHAIGNIALKLNEWKVDFAAWCSYKYLNSGPGSVGGIYVNEKWANNPELPRLAGWWGYPAKTRFQMLPDFIPAEGADGWQLSNAPVLAMAAHKASLDIFEKAGIQNLIQKSKLLTSYLEFIIDDVTKNHENCSFEIITPKDWRGAQLSILTHGTGKELYDFITKKGVVADWREPNVIRIAPAPLYNSFEDVYQFGQILKQALEN